MGARRLAIAWAGLALVVPAHALAADPVGNVQRPARTATDTAWFGVSMGFVVSPMPRRSTGRLDSSRMRACGDAGPKQTCSLVRGADIRFQFFGSRDEAFPRFIGYLRTGFEGGWAGIDPHASGAYLPGEAKQLRYLAVPLFIGVNVYAFRRFPLRPFVGVGAGADILRLHVTRQRDGWTDSRSRTRGDVDSTTSVRLGVEAHGGLELRIHNAIALTTELRYQWGVPREIPQAPDFANRGLSIIVGVMTSGAIAEIARQPRQRRRRGA